MQAETLCQLQVVIMTAMLNIYYFDIFLILLPASKFIGFRSLRLNCSYISQVIIIITFIQYMKTVKTYKSHKNGLFKSGKKNINWSMLINTCKINFIYMLISENKVDIDYKDDAKVSKIWFSSWIVQESLNFYLKRNYVPCF